MNNAIQAGKRKAEEDINSVIQRHPSYNKVVRWNASNFLLGPVLGRGGFGEVHVAKEKWSGALVAIKKIKKNNILDHCDRKMVRDEASIMSSLDHPHILKFYTWFQDPIMVYFVLELAPNGSVRSLMSAQPQARLSNDMAAKVTYQTADALLYLHRRDIVHRDIKPENILLSASMDVRLADFGIAAKTNGLHLMTNIGTSVYKPPEMVEGRPYSIHVDTWCLGVTIYQMIVGMLPFNSKHSPIIETLIRIVDIQYLEFMDYTLRDLLDGIFIRNDKDRPSMFRIQNHDWVKRYYQPDQPIVTHVHKRPNNKLSELETMTSNFVVPDMGPEPEQG